MDQKFETYFTVTKEPIINIRYEKMCTQKLNCASENPIVLLFIEKGKLLPVYIFILLMIMLLP
jgi:hypothetical protein